jgi:CBS domain-containing protein/anti-sigma regulatory factor (Ser/Thr protein kinase)
MDNRPKRKGIVISDRAVENVTRAEELAYELKVNEVMTPNVQAIAPDMSMGQVVEIFRQKRFSGAPVAIDGTPVGIVTMEDLIRAITKGDANAPVTGYMTPNPFTIKATDPVVEALKVFVNSQVGRLPVVNDQDKLIGILTKGDITRGLLKALQQDYQEEEIRIYRASHLFQDIESDRTSLIMRYNIAVRDFTKGGTASAAIKRALLRLGATPQIARRCGIAAYEAEMNLIIHTTNGGILRVEIEPHRISMEAVDDGPGIKDVELAMKPGYSTASEEIRELGFGAGMGLVNIARCVDNMVLESQVDKGTRLKMKIFLEKSETVGERHSGN